MKKIILALLFVSNVTLGDSLYILGNSVHVPQAKATNGKHNFLVYERNDYVAGTFINSYGDRTYTMGYRYGITDEFIPDVSLNLLAGLTYGYKQCIGRPMHDSAVVCPSVVVEFRYTKYDIQPTVFFTGGAAVLLFNIEF
jgi:hypothetical protein